MEKDFTENENTETGFTLVDSPEERPEKPSDKPELIEDKPDDGVIGHDAAGVGLDIGTEFLGRRGLTLLFGPAGHQGGEGCRQKEDSTHICNFQNRR